MKKKGLFYVCALFLLMMGVAACSKDSDEFTFQDYNLENIEALVEKGQIPTQFVSINEFPNWLQDIIETQPDFNPLWVFQFTWKGSTHYLLYNAMMNGPYQGFYTQDGQNLDGYKLWNDIKANSSGWTLVYETRPLDE